MAIRFLQISGAKELEALFTGLKVDPYGIKIMAPKAGQFLILLEDIPCFAANILKQELLSCGGDVALPRGVLTGRNKKTGCVLIATLSQLNRLREKLVHQPFGLSRLSGDLGESLKNYLHDGHKLKFGPYKLFPARRTLVMGILNLTPDSFSGDGLWGNNPDAVCDRAKRLVDDGADMLDLGGESSRPGAEPVPLKEELKRVIPAVRKISKAVKVPVSIDTCKPEVARQALDNGALIVNDISGLRNTLMAGVCARYKSGVVIMHMKGDPRTMQKKPVYDSVLGDILGFLESGVMTALKAGVDRSKIIIDPGIGFGKTLEHNLEILRNLKELKVLGLPILIGTSRKGFIGKILQADPGQRLAGTIASCVLASANGADIVRVHDVKPVRQALEIKAAISNQVYP